MSQDCPICWICLDSGGQLIFPCKCPRYVFINLHANLLQIGNARVYALRVLSHSLPCVLTPLTFYTDLPIRHVLHGGSFNQQALGELGPTWHSPSLFLCASFFVSCLMHCLRLLFYRKEWHCEFCDSNLPDWKQTLTPTCGSKAPAVMNVNFDGRTYSFEVKPGPDGYRLFTESIRRAFSLSDDSELHITFTCDEPTGESIVMSFQVLHTGFVSPLFSRPLCSHYTLFQNCYLSLLFAAPEAGSLLTLQGPGAYDAAVHCASVSAARRLSTPTSRTASMPSEMMGGPSTPRSPLGLARSASFPSPGSIEPASPDALASASHVGEDGAPASKRRLSSIGRRMRSFLDLLSVRQ